MQTTDIIAAIDRHAKATGLKATSIGQMAVRNGRLYENLKAGGSIQISTANRLMDWMAADLASRNLCSPSSDAPLSEAS